MSGNIPWVIFDPTLSFTPIFASISLHCWYSHSNHTVGIVCSHCCKSSLTGLLDFLISPLPSLFYIEDMGENTNQIMSCFHATLQLLPITLRGEILVSFHELKAMHFPALIYLSNLILDFSLIYLSVMFLTPAKLIPDSWWQLSCMLSLALSTWRLACCH